MTTEATDPAPSAPTGPTGAGAASPRVDLAVTWAIDAGLRRDATRLARAVALTEPGDRARWVALAQRWRLFGDVLRMQCRGQDGGVWPLVRARGSAADAATTRALEAEHRALLASLAVCEDLLGRLAAAPDPAVAAAAAVRASGLRDALLRHLDHEERDGLPLLHWWVTPQEWRVVDRDHFLRPAGPRLVLRLAAWAAHDLPADRLSPALRSAGPGFRLLLVLTRGRFERAERRLLGGRQ